jgi:hypothetical protein
MREKGKKLDVWVKNRSRREDKMEEMMVERMADRTG